MPYLVLVRHGQSEWNALGLWTGLTDVSLTEEGRKEAQAAAEALKDIELHALHCSKLKRAKETLDEIKHALKCAHLPVSEHEALNERDYGELTGKNKWKIKEEHGEEKFMQWRRSWDHPVPGGETLKDVHARAIPYFEEHVKKDLKEGRNVLVSAHGNTLRALVKHLENITDHEISDVEIGTGEVWVYEIDDNGVVCAKEIRSVNDNKKKT